MGKWARKPFVRAVGDGVTRRRPHAAKVWCRKGGGVGGTRLGMPSNAKKHFRDVWKSQVLLEQLRRCSQKSTLRKRVRGRGQV